jgi:hypothetical protein
VVDLDSKTRNELAKIAKNWYENISRYKYRSISDFESPQKVLDGINRGKFPLQSVNANELFSSFEIKIFKEHFLTN